MNSRHDFEKQRLKFTEEYKQSLQADRRKLYERYHFQDAAIKVVGVGSVGTRCYLSLLLADEDDPLFLQFKEARTVGTGTSGTQEPLCEPGIPSGGGYPCHAGRKRHLPWLESHQRA